MMPHSMYGPHVLPSPVHSPAGVLGTLAGTSWEPPERRRQDHSGTPDALQDFWARNGHWWSGLLGQTMPSLGPGGCFGWAHVGLPTSYPGGGSRWTFLQHVASALRGLWGWLVSGQQVGQQAAAQSPLGLHLQAWGKAERSDLLVSDWTR